MPKTIFEHWSLLPERHVPGLNAMSLNARINAEGCNMLILETPASRLYTISIHRSSVDEVSNAMESYLYSLGLRLALVL